MLRSLGGILAFPGSFVVAQDCTGRRGRRPLQMNKQIAIIVRCFGGVTPSIQYQWKKERRGEQCSPVQFSGNVRPRVLAPTATVHWLPSRGAPTDRRVRGGPTGMGILPATPQSPSVTAPLKGSHPLRPLFWPRRGQSEKK